VNRRPIWTPGENAITHYSQTIFEKKEGVTIGRRSNTPEINNSASASTVVSGGEVVREVRTYETTTTSLIALSEWLAANGCTHVAMEATGVYWKPVWHILDDGDFQLILTNSAHVKNVPGRKTDVNDATWLRTCWRMV
jgi:hypothetical protein